MKLTYFRDDEFLCKCGCGMDVKDELKRKADIARGFSGVPYRVTSGARCQKHNKAVGGTENSSHTKGLAMDIAYTDEFYLAKIIYGLTIAGFRRIGVNTKKKFVHADIDRSKPNAIFKY